MIFFFNILNYIYLYWYWYWYWVDAFYKSICLCVCPYVCPFSMILLIFFFILIDTDTDTDTGLMLSISQFVCVFFSYVCLSVHFLRYNLNVFMPPLPKVVKWQFLESLGKSNIKKWSQTWKLSLIKGVNRRAKKSLCLGEFCLTEQDFFGISVSHSV